jgi:hypothetical protein
MAAPVTLQAMQSKPWDDMKPLLEKYKMIRPKNVEATTKLGGLWVLDAEGKVW